MCNVQVIPIRYLSVCIMYVCMHASRTSCKKNMHNLAINVNITSSLPLGAIAPYSFLFADAAAAALAVASCKRLQLVAGSKRCLPLPAWPRSAPAPAPRVHSLSAADWRPEETRIIDQKPVASTTYCKYIQTYTYACMCVCVCVCRCPQETSVCG